MTNTIYCTYLTVYSGNKLPPFYIGSTSIEKINKGYHGSVQSKKYKQIWKSELKDNPHLFKSKIITTHSSREEALNKEYIFQTLLSVVDSCLYINESYAKIHGYFGRQLYGKYNHFYGKKHSLESRQKMKGIKNHMYGKKYHMSIETRNKISNSLKGRNLKDKNYMYGKTHTEETRKNISLKVSGNKNGSYGKKWYYNPLTNENIRCYPTDKPDNYLPGRKI